MSRTVKLTLQAEVGAFKRDMLVAAGAARKAAKETEAAGLKASSGIGKLNRVANMHEKAWGQVSTGLMVGGAAAAAGVGLVTKAAIDWESAWTGVKKTVDGTPEQLGQVEDGLRELARTLPSTHTEIAAVAEAAGQLGIKTGDVVGFTKTMIDLGETTNLSAEEAATGLARFSNIMGTSASDVDRLGSTLVGLGNNYATTEAEILDMSMRLSGAGRQIKLSEGEVLGLSAAMSSVGIESEAGGTAMSTTMKKIGKAVDSGSGALDSFAEVAGMSAEQFSTLWKDDAAGALEAFVGGLGKAGESGESVNAILTDLGITGIREADALLRLSSAAGIMGDAMAQGNVEFEANNALLEEADKRYSTTESKIKAAWSSIQDAAITAGGVLLPIVAGIADGAAGIATAFSKIPAPVAGALTVMTGFLGIGALVAGVGMKMIGSFTATVGGLRALGLEFPGLTGKMEKFGNAAPGIAKKFAKFAGAAIAIGAVTVAIAKLAEASYMSQIDDGMGRVDLAMAKIISSAPDAGDALDGLFKNKSGEGITGDIDSLGSAIDRTFNKTAGQKFNDWGENLVTSTTGVKGSLAITEEAFGRIDNSLADLVNSGNVAGAKAAFDGIAAKFVEQGREVEEAEAMFPGYADALAGVAAEAVNAGTGLNAASGAAGGLAKAFVPSDDMAKALEEVGLAADGTVSSLAAYTDALFASGLAVMSSKEAAFGWADSLRDMGDKIKEVTKEQGKLGPALNKGMTDFNESTDSGKAALELFNGTVREGLSVASTFANDTTKSQKDVQAQLESTYKAAYDTARGFDVSKEAATGLAREALQIPDGVDIKTWMSDEALRMAEAITGQVLAIPDGTEIKVLVTEDGTVALTQGQIDAIKGQTVGVEVTDEGTVLTTQGKIDGVTDGDAKILVGEDGTVSIVQSKIGGVKDGSATVNVGENGVNAVQNAINSIKGKSVTINATYQTHGTPFKAALSVMPGGKAAGGRVEGLASGGRVPRTGLGTDKVMGVNADGIPHVRVDDREWVINRRSSDKHDGLLKMINEDDPRIQQLKSMLGYAKGGRAGAAEKKVTGLKRAYEKIDGKKDNRPRKLAAKWAYEDAKKELAAIKAGDKKAEAAAKKTASERKKAADKAEAARKKAAEDEKARQGRLSDSRRELGTDLRRGNITDAFTSGSGLGQIDKLYDASRNKDYSKSKRQGLARDAKALEKSLTILTKKSDGLKVSMEAATEARDDLLAVKNDVSRNLQSAFSLSGVMDWAGRKESKVTVKDVRAMAGTRRNQVEKYKTNIAKLRKMGYSSAVIQDIGSMGLIEGAQMAEALMAGDKTDVVMINNHIGAIARHADGAGIEVTKSMRQGGIDAAQGLVDGLESKQKDVDSAFYNLGKSAEKSFRRSLDMHSPSRTLFKAGADAGDGVVGGGLASIPKVADTFAQMGYAAENAFSPTLSVPPSAEVARYAVQPAGGGSAQQIAAAVGAEVRAAMRSYQPMVNIGGRQFHGVMQETTQRFEGR